MLKFAAKEFCLRTSLHGYKFLMLPKRVLLEKSVWSIIITTSVIVSMAVSWLAWLEIEEHVVQTVTDSTRVPIWEYHFPAVTICSFNQLKKDFAITLVKNLKKPSNITKEMMNYLRHLPLLVTVSDSKVSLQNLTKLQDILDYNNKSVYDMALYLNQYYLGMDSCKWKGEKKRCDTLFEPIATPLGFCCSFNYYATKEHEFGAAANKIPTRPRRVTASGYKTALEVVLNNYPQKYFATDVASYGYKIFVHHPYSYPDWSVRSLLLQMGTTMFLSVSPMSTKCNPQAAALPIQQRNCLFTNERKMDRFKYYTHHNCLTECRMRILIRNCGCIPYYYYSSEGTFNNTRICDLRDYVCVSDNRGIILSSIPDRGKHPEEDRCNCLPDCEYCRYPVESSTGKLSNKWESSFKIFFNDLVATRNTKVICYHWHTIFALLGGLLSLFTGFSFGAVFELLYFFTIRLLVKRLRNENNELKKQNRSFNKSKKTNKAHSQFNSQSQIF